MQLISYAFCFTSFAWLVIRIQTSKKLIAIVLCGTLMMMLVGVPQPAHAQSGLLSSIQAVLTAINGVIQTTLEAINTARSAVNNLQQVVAWPQQLINQARAQVTQMIGQYRTLMTSIFRVNLASATLPTPQTFEAVLRDHQVNNFSSLTTAFGNTYGLIPAPTAANPTDRALSDMDDALALDNFKMLKASDQAADIELESADSI